MTYDDAVRELYFVLNSNGDNYHAVLYRLISKADPHNKALLRLSYPLEVLAFDNWQQSHNEEEFFESVIGKR